MTDHPTEPRPSATLTITAHTETVSAVTAQSLGAEMVSLMLGDDRAGVMLIGQHADVLRLIGEAGVKLLSLHDPAELPVELRDLAYLVQTGDYRGVGQADPDE